jgi:septal ring factor EnvC (AmiA/AmiB activator)
MKFISLISIFILSFSFSFGQLSAELKKKQNDLKNTRNLLKKIEKKSDKSVKKLNIIARELEQSKDYLESISQQIDAYDKQISSNKKAISDLTKENEKIKKEYENLIYFAYKTRNSRDKSTYIFASENFEQAYKRFKYLIYLTDYIKETSNDYKNTADSIVVLNSTLKIQKSQLLDLNQEKENELRKLARSKQTQKNELKKLNNKKNVLLSEIEREEKNAELLRQAIAKQIADEREKQKKSKTSTKTKKSETKKNVKTDTKKSTKEKKEKVEKSDSEILQKNEKTNTKNLSNFEKNKGKLNIPLHGEITGNYGNHQHPVLKNVSVKNDGIDITATGDLSVHAVFDGIVSKIVSIPGANKAVILKHENYFSVYSNIVDIKVKENQKVKKNQIIGAVFSEKGNPEKSVINFQIWKDREKQNPADWLKK